MKTVHMVWEFFKDLWKISNRSQKFPWNFFFIKIFLIIHSNVKTFRIIHNTSKTFIVVSKAVNDTSRSAHIIKIGWHSHRILYTHSIENCLNLSIFEVVEIQHMKHENRVVTKKTAIYYPLTIMQKLCLFICENPNLICG